VSGFGLPNLPILEVPQDLTDADGVAIRLTQWNPQTRVGADIQVSLQGEIDPTGVMPNLYQPLDCGDGRVLRVMAGGVHYKPTPAATGGVHYKPTPAASGAYILSVTAWLEVPAAWLLGQQLQEHGDI
jgi:hypothetical protein